MKLSGTSRYALRSLSRNRRRTLISVVGVAIGVAIGLLNLSWVRGERTTFLRAAAGSGAGHLRVTPEGWNESRDMALRLDGGEQELAAIRELDEVAVATPRVRMGGLLAMGTRVASPEITGVDPATEPGALRFVQSLAEGRYLEPGDRGVTVIGRALAARLEVGVEDELVATVVDPQGEIQSALFTVVGLIDTGSRAIDSALCHVPIADGMELSGHVGLGEITIILHDPLAMEVGRAAVAGAVSGTDELLEWDQVSAELAAGVKADEAFAGVTVGVILFVVLLGIMSARLTSVLQRRKELSVLRALGMSAGRIWRLMFTEGLALGLAGWLLSLLFAFGPVYYLATTGIDIRDFMGEGDLAMSGVLMEPIMYADFGAWLLPYAAGLSLVATLLASIYPAWFAVRIEPASGVRVDQ